jgi:prophage regulatory protein
LPSVRQSYSKKKGFAPAILNNEGSRDVKKIKREALQSAAPPPALRLIPKREVLAIVGVTYPSLWTWMRAGKFPRSRIVGGQSMWLSTDIDQWLANLPRRALKGDASAA